MIDDYGTRAAYQWAVTDLLIRNKELMDQNSILESEVYKLSLKLGGCTAAAEKLLDYHAAENEKLQKEAEQLRETIENLERQIQKLKKKGKP